MMRFYGFSRLLVADEIVDAPLAAPIVTQFVRVGLPVQVVPAEAAEASPWIKQAGTLALLPRPELGWCSKASHGTLAVRPNEYYLHPVMGCRAYCTYCYLGGREFGRRPLRFHVLVDELYSELAGRSLDRETGTPLYCTGELADSLMDADLFPVGAALAERFSVGDIGRLELRTKSADVSSLLQVNHAGRTVVSFSISPAEYVRRYEPGTASLDERLRAARALAMYGYKIAMKFEPILLREDWESAYQELFFEVRRALDPLGLEHVSVGVLRWNSQLQQSAVFKRNHEVDMANGAWINYRPGNPNGTISRTTRVQAYRRVRTMLERAEINCPIWWSLEEEDVISALA